MINPKKAKVIAFYLPQFHPIPENNEWWGNGFTEWNNVVKAKPLFKGHQQPKIPADLGFYDLRLPEVREEQAKLASEAGVDAFCYWHYWFGNGKQLLEKPLQEVIKTGKPDFPFCLAWANHTWLRKQWNGEISAFEKTVLIEQLYPGREDIDSHFYTILPILKSPNYYKLHGRLVFVFYHFEGLPDSDYFIDRWQELAKENGLPGFYFIGHSRTPNPPSCYKKLDAFNLYLMHDLFTKSKIRRLLSVLLKRPTNIVNYSKAIKAFRSEAFKKEKIYPTIIPNWDHTPRTGARGSVLQNSTPTLFKKHVEQIIELISEKEEEDKVIFLKSWNEWAEGNYMEPDQRFGKGYIIALKEALFK